MPHQHSEDMLHHLQTLFDVGVVAALTDGELLEQFARRDGETAEIAFATLVERHGSMVLRVCRAIVGNDQDAQDAFQATFHTKPQRDTWGAQSGQSRAGWHAVETGCAAG